jgi:RNA-directed DNA polymerase
MQLTANGTQGQTDWLCVNWRKVNRIVRNLRQRIFRATTEGDLKKVRALQKLMLRCYSNCLLSVRKVTQQNRGKYTPGVDQVVVKTPTARGKLVDQIVNYTPWQASPARRVYIPKANGKQRPLGIATIPDRCLQAVVKNALEPEWEAQFECSSYGFRPGRSPHDAIEKIYRLAVPRTRKKWVLDADIRSCFDQISQSHLLETIGQFPARELIRQWLKAGYMEAEKWYPTEAGTPQGSVVSPLLANIALHGMEAALGVRYRVSNGGVNLQSKRAVVRFADDFAVFCETRADAEASRQILDEWMKARGLTFSDEKTRIVHLSEGFDFLGFNIRQYPVPHARTGWKLLIKPSKQSMQKIRNQLRQIWLDHLGKPLDVLIKKLNPIIRGQAHYFRIGVASRLFHQLDTWMYQRAQRWVKRTHPNKSDHWRVGKYWGRLNFDRPLDRWVFGSKHTGAYLLKYRWFPIQRHTLVKGYASPDDPNLRDYWRQRAQAKAKTELLPSRQKIAQKQGYVCPVCGETLLNEEVLQLHHKQPKAQGGDDSYGNLQLLHLYCHQQVHSGTVKGS